MGQSESNATRVHKSLIKVNVKAYKYELRLMSPEKVDLHLYCYAPDIPDMMHLIYAKFSPEYQAKHRVQVQLHYTVINDDALDLVPLAPSYTVYNRIIVATSSDNHLLGTEFPRRQ